MADHAPARTEGGTMIVVLTIALVGSFTLLGLAKVLGAAAVVMAAGLVGYLVLATAAIA